MFRIFILVLWVINAFGVNYPFLNRNCYVDNLISIQDPFFKKTTNIKSNFSLQAIVSNKIKINDKWYALNDYIDGFKIVEIRNSQVVLKKEEKIMVLNLYEKNSIFMY
ncbi:hypothetical protein IO384_001291 [Campylobacter lari]|uniref:hypothetical protein n=1 Tax=unclassified Campylobacter TaxID=2593542 RepID=UPI0012839E25|nr:MULTISPECIES: hypothetical protein [unclassified Campylobacter]EAK0441050.1 hypothetical protein [Campylobacter lari]EAK0818168.1 hypothetical protein [Campylobacter lari]EAK9881997.1 hypothetical protein [Campylobacter lari]EAK9890799.1 hypothetical protein [Campylobacter lari]EGK8025212.1 hypothetical protein [Campylobacter lari]